MVYRHYLRPGDQIRLLCIPAADLQQRERELREGSELAGWTADTIERIIARDPVVVISRIDELATPWFDVELTTESGEAEQHTIAIMEDESWERVDGLSMPLLELRAGLEYEWTQQPVEKIRQCGLAAEALSLLCEQLHRPEPGIRASACLALDYLDDSAAVPKLLPLLNDAEPMVAMRAADALCRFGAPAIKLLPRLIEVLSQPEVELPRGTARVLPPCGVLQMPESRYHAARILGYLGEEAAPARQGLLDALQSGSGMVRGMAARALAGIGEPPETYLAPLRQALDDVNVQSSRERENVAETLYDLGEPVEPLVDRLAELVSDEDWGAACMAMLFLQDLGPVAKSAVPALRLAMSSDNPGVAEQAEAALREITR